MKKTITVSFPADINPAKIKSTIEGALMKHQIAMQVIQLGINNNERHFQLTTAADEKAFFYAGIATGAIMSAYHNSKKK